MDLQETSSWTPGKDGHKDGRRPNLNPKFVKEFSEKLALTFITDGRGDLEKEFGPEDILHYMYAVFHSPSYRERYAEFLKIDFPRVPLTSDVGLFKALCPRGRELVALHLMESPGLDKKMTIYPETGDHLVDKGYPKYFAPGETAPGSKEPLEKGRVYISKTQYFEGVPPDVWEFQVGGYQVCHKWLKDRKGRNLSYDERIHYQKIVVALNETIRLMEEIDELIEEHGGWPIK